MDESNDYEEYYSTLKSKYALNGKKKENKLSKTINIFIYQLIFVLILTFFAYTLKTGYIKNSSDILTFVDENIYFNGILPPYIEKFEIIQKVYDIFEKGYDKVRVNTF